MGKGEMNKIAIFVAVALVLIGVLVWRYVSRKEVLPPSIKTAEEALDAVTDFSVRIESNPMEDKVPELNPVDIANPFSSSYKNPFE